MRELMEFFADIFMINKNKNERLNIGLTQFKKKSIAVVEPKRKVVKKEVKLSDLMRGMN